jgi:hypothetical protein
MLISLKKSLLGLTIILAGLSLNAQDNSKSDAKAEKKQRINAIIKQEEEGNLSFRKQTAFGLMLRTNGYGAFLEVGRRRSARFTNTYSIEITETKNKKEEKVNGNQNVFSNSFFYGKIYNFYSAKLGFGQQYIFGQKGNKNGVAVIGTMQGGVALGFLKPYYLEVLDQNSKQRLIKYEDDTTLFVGPTIIGPGGLGKGWSELKFRPGLYLRSALRFDFGRYNDNIQALEIGMSIEAYGQKILTQVDGDPKQLYFQGHVAFVFGHRK